MQGARWNWRTLFCHSDKYCGLVADFLLAVCGPEGFLSGDNGLVDGIADFVRSDLQYNLYRGMVSLSPRGGF